MIWLLQVEVIGCIPVKGTHIIKYGESILKQNQIKNISIKARTNVCTCK